MWNERPYVDGQSLSDRYLCGLSQRHGKQSVVDIDCGTLSDLGLVTEVLQLEVRGTLEKAVDGKSN